MIVIVLKVDLRFMWSAVKLFVQRKPMVLRLPDVSPYYNYDGVDREPESTGQGPNPVVH